MSRWIVVGDTEEERRNKSEVLAVHAALLHTGHILYFGGDEHDPGRNVRGRTDRSVLHTARLFDCGTDKVSTVQQLDTDVFCCGHAFLEDGRLIVAGGTGSYDETEEDVLKDHPQPNPHHHFSGLPNTFIFDPTSLTWMQADNMRPRPRGSDGGRWWPYGGRWYPTLVTLPDGNILAMSGHPHKTDLTPHPTVPNYQDHTHDRPEIFYTSEGRWRMQNQLGHPSQSYYPRLHVIDGFENGMQAFTSSGLYQMDYHCYVFNPYNPTIREAVCNLVDPQGNPVDGIYFGYRCTSVLLPLLPQEGYQPRILLFGGERALIVNPLSRTWEYAADRDLQPSPRRYDANSVILPTGEIFFCGGVSEMNESANFSNEEGRAVKRGEIYNPRRNRRNRWTITDTSAEVIRTYHSVALLMPDGRVWTAGSNRNGNYSYRDVRQFDPNNPFYANDHPGIARRRARSYRHLALVRGEDDPDPSQRHRELRIEIFEPWYYASPERPRIVPPMPTHVRWGDIFKIGFESSRVITSAAMIRAGSVTHAFNSDQRYVGLVIEELGLDGKLTLRAPPKSTIAPPGYYLLFIIDKNGVPSTGTFVRLSELPSVPTIEREIRVLVEWGVEEPNPVTYLKTIKGIDKPLSQDKNKALQQIADIRKQLTDQFNNGMMEKSAFDALDKAVSKYIESKRL